MVIEAYTRKSRALGDPDDPALLDKVLAHHLAQIRRMAQADGIDLAEDAIYTEIGSGETIAQRPVFAARLAAWERLPEGSGGRIYVPELARLTRGDWLDVGRVAAAIRRAGLLICTPGRSYDLRTADDTFVFGVLCVAGHYQIGRYKELVAAKKDEMTRSGKLVTGGDRYGYRWNKDLQTLLPHEPEFSIACALFRDALHMSDLQLSARYGLRPDQISDILRNPIYSGYPHRHTKGVANGTRWLPRDEWLLAEKPGDWPPACSVELWEQVQQARARRYRERAKPGATNGWCRDILVLIDDQGREYRPSLGAQTLRHCSNPTYVAQGAEYILHVPRADVHACAFHAIQSVCRDRDFLLQAVARCQARQRVEADSRPSPQATEAAAERIAELRRELDALLLEQIRAATPEARASIARVRAGHEQEIERLQREVQRRQRQAVAAVDLAELLPLLPRLVEPFDRVWTAMEDPERRALANVFIERLPARVLRQAPRRPYVREVGPVVYQAWWTEE